MSGEDFAHERTPLLSPEHDHSVGPPSGRPRTLSDALTHITNTPLDCLVPSDLPNAVAIQSEEASAPQYGFALTALLYCRQEKLRVQHMPVELDLYSQWTQDKSLKGELELVERHLDTMLENFLVPYRTNQEIDAVLWTKYRKDDLSDIKLRAMDFLQTANPPIRLLTHPLVEAAVRRRWKQGVHYPSTQLSYSFMQRLDSLFGTPRNMHVLALGSHVAYLIFLAHFLLWPPDRASTNVQSYLRIIGRYEVGLVLFSIANVTFVPFNASFLYWVVLAAFLLPFPSLPQPEDGFFDVLSTVFALHIWGLQIPSPISPLLIYDLPKSIPLAEFVHRSIMGGLTPTLFYFGPALIVSILLLSFSLDGDYVWLVQSLLESTSLGIPAPMETRSVFLVIVFVIASGLVFSIFATTVAVAASSYPFQTSSNTWDRFGAEIGHRSRVVAVSACAMFSEPYLYPPPFNLLHAIFIVPLDFCARMSGRSVGWVKMLDVGLWRLVVLPFSVAAFVVSKVLG